MNRPIKPMTEIELARAMNSSPERTPEGPQEFADKAQKDAARKIISKACGSSLRDDDKNCIWVRFDKYFWDALEVWSKEKI